MNTQTQAIPLFAARLTPNRSLSPHGIRVVIAVLVALALLPGIIFYDLGAWPVIAFMVADVGVLFWALTHSVRDSRRFEQVTLWPDRLEIVQASPTGESHKQSFAPDAVRLVIERDFDERTTGITLRSADRDLVIGSFLTPDDKASFAKVFGTALKKARR